MADKQQEPADTYHRHGDLDPSKWDEQETVTARPNDLGSVTNEPALANSTLASRAKKKPATKAIKGDDVENKSLKRSASK